MSVPTIVTGGKAGARLGSLSSAPHHLSSREEQPLLSSCQSACHEDQDHEIRTQDQQSHRTGSDRCVNHNQRKRRRSSTGGRTGDHRQQDHRRSRRSSSHSTSLIHWTTSLLTGLVDDWIKNMRIKKPVSCKIGEEPDVRVDDGTDSGPRLLFVRREGDQSLATDVSPPLVDAAVVREEQESLSGSTTHVDAVTAETQCVSKGSDDHADSSPPSSSSSSSSSSSPEQESRISVFAISFEGGDCDGEQVQGLSAEQTVIAIGDRESKDQKDVNGNFGHQVTASLTVTSHPLIRSSAATVSAFDNPVFVVHPEDHRPSHPSHEDTTNDKQLNPSHGSQCKTRSWMAGHESGPGVLPVDRTFPHSLQIECISCSVHSAPSPLLSSPKYLRETQRFASNPGFIRPSTSTSVNSIVIEESIEDDAPFDQENGCNCDACQAVSGRRASDPDRNEKIQQETRKQEEEAGAQRETTWRVIRELILAFLLAGLGNVAASYWLAKVQSWSVFKNIPQLVILVPPLLGLKGNVEMTLASRLSTHANLGDMDTKTGRRQLILGNMALIQCQASTVGFVAPIIALGLSLMSERPRLLRWPEIVLLVASSVITANVANLILGTLMCGVILMARKHHINPDNIATPIAASLGDVTTMILLANISHFLYVSLDANQWVQNALLAFLMSLIPVWAYIARKNPFTHKVILNGWYPVCGAMLIQNAGGLVMERALRMFDKIANLQLLINGVGGNLVAIQSSRMSTHLHKYSVPKELPKTDPTACTYPGSTFFSKTSVHTPMARILLCLAIPSHLTFLLVTEFVNKKYFLTAPFILIYLLIGAIHVAILLQLAHMFVHWLWKVGVNPDNTAIPFLTAFADLVGSVLLFTSFVLLFLSGDPNAYDASRFVSNATTPVHTRSLSHGLL